MPADLIINLVIAVGILAATGLVIWVAFSIGAEHGRNEYRAVAVAARIADHADLTDEINKLATENVNFRQEIERLRNAIVDKALAATGGGDE